MGSSFDRQKIRPRHHLAMFRHRDLPAELLQAFGVNVLAYDPLLDEAAIAAMGAKKADLDTLLAESDVVSLHAPALDSTRHMINGRALSLMKDRAILINTARGALVDEEALAQALTLIYNRFVTVCKDAFLHQTRSIQCVSEGNADRSNVDSLTNRSRR